MLLFYCSVAQEFIVVQLTDSLTMGKKGQKTKFSVFGLLREYSENASIHGIAYVYSAANAVEKIVW